jgi:hypothetical protein
LRSRELAFLALKTQQTRKAMASLANAGVPDRFGLWIILAAALIYCLWLGWHWLPLGYSDKELAASASRVWDVKRELTEHGRVPWWTPYFMSGSSYALNHSRGFYLLPWLLFSTFTSLDVAGKLMALCAIFASAVTMYFCARHFLRHEWAAVLAGAAYMLCPEQLTRAATQEHMTISLFMPFVPLVWWLFARMLRSGRFRDVFWCALAFVFAMWTDYKQVFVQGVFLFGYLLYWLWLPERRAQWKTTVRTCLVLGAVSLGLGAAFLVPGFVESKYVKLFEGDPFEAWQRTYAFKSLLALVDRDAVITSNAIQGVMGHAQAGGYRPTTQEEATALQNQIVRVHSLRMDSPEKYAGLVLLALIGWTALFNHRRADRRLFWFYVGTAMASISLGTGLSNVASASWETFTALMELDGVPATARLAVVLTVVTGVAGLVFFARRKLTTQRKWTIAGGVLVAFLFLPVFGLLAHLPAFKEIRAPGVFYGLPFSFLGAMLAGFFVTDVLEVERWRAHIPKVVAAVAALLLTDYWPYQKAMHENSVAETTLKNLEATYTALRKDPDWVKTYSISGRYFHLLGPMYGGKPQVYEAFYNWMCPLGTGLLNQTGAGSPEMFNLLAARYIVFDKTDPDMQSAQLQQVLASYRRGLRVASENEDFVVFSNATAHAYVTAYARPCLFVGDVRGSPKLALDLAARNWPLVHSEKPFEAAMIGEARYEIVYFFHGEGHEMMVRPGLLNNLSIFNETTPPRLPRNSGEVVPLAGVTLVREDPQKIRVHLTAPRDCLAVISESYYPYWHAEVDGKPTEVLRVSCAFMGVNLPAGTHEIVLRYEPPRAYALAGVISLVVFVIGAGLSLRSR